MPLEERVGLAEVNHLKVHKWVFLVKHSESFHGHGLTLLPDQVLELGCQDLLTALVCVQVWVDYVLPIHYLLVRLPPL